MTPKRYRMKFGTIVTILLIAPAVSAGIACLANPCFHGICIDDINSTYACYCTDGYTGVQCQTNWDECWSSPCQNGGTCVDGVATYNCSCPDGFIGDNCETNYNECESNPCLNNGTCIDMTNEYVCRCMPGFSGLHCEVDVAVCNSTEEVRCYNGGECIEGPGFKFYCKCLAGWKGPSCDEQIDECDSSPCQNGGICIDAHADYMCACTYGYTGKNCEVQIEFCDKNSCENDALCVVEEGERICYCVPDFHGDRCELQYDECLLEPRCLNGGTCIDGVDNYTCSCPPNLTGGLCECLILNNGSYDCDYVGTTIKPTESNEDVTTATHSAVTISDNILTSIGFTSSLNNVSSIGYTTTLESTTSAISSGITTIDFNILTNPTMLDVTTTPESTETSFEISTGTTIKLDEPDQDATTATPLSQKTEDTATTEKYTTMISSPEGSIETDLTESTTKETTVPIDITTMKLTEGTPETHFVSTTETITEKTSITIPEEVTFLPTTIHLDTTTEKLFTETPLETTVPPTTLTTYSIETSTSVESTSQVLITTPSICSELTCNNHGICHSSLHGIRCQCAFNYGGKYCEDKISIKSAAFDGSSYIVHQIKNSTSIDIEFNARTLITDGQIMHVDIAKGIYMELFMMLGLLKFQFSCGYQTMLLSELKTFVNKGYPMKIETRLDLNMKDQHCNATIRLNDTLAMSGGQIANISFLDDNTTIYFGNALISNNTENKHFIGCIRDLTVNGESREVFGDAQDAAEVAECSSLACLSGPCLNGGTCSDHGDTYICSCANGWMGENCNQSICEHNPCRSGGSCVRHPGSGFLCLCPYGKHGIFCEYTVEISRPSLAPIASGKSSYVIYPLSPTTLNSDRFDFRMRFQSTDMDQIALLMFVGQNGRHDSKSQHMALTFVKGYIMLTWNMGSGPRRIFTARSARRGAHSVRVWRRGRTAGLTLDARLNISGNAPAGVRNNLTLHSYIYIGGHPSEGFRELPHDLPLHAGWNGCVWDVSGPAVGGRAVGGRGAGQCGVSQCTAKSCNSPRGVCIHSPATYGCICNEGWYGATCNAAQGACDPQATKCRGRCTITLDGADCDCPYGKTGDYCNQDLVPTDILLSGIRSYIELHPRSVSSVSLSIEADIKPMKERGLILFIETPHFYTSLSLQGGLLEYRWSDVLSGVTSVVRSGAVADAGAWHGVRAGRYGGRLYVWLDGALTSEPLAVRSYPHTAATAAVIIGPADQKLTITCRSLIFAYVGGTKDLSSLPFDVMSGPPESYYGCIRSLHINNIPVPLDSQNIKEGVNVGTCSGGACGGAGARCRRGCLSAGHCDTGMNKTVPQFDGSAMLSLTRSVSGRSGHLKLMETTRVTFNFTTSEPDGLLLWIYMGHYYIGLGLEHGYLKLEWSLICNALNKSDETYPVHPKLAVKLVQAGFMADGEWHAVNLNLKEHTSLIIDHKLYIDERCILGDNGKFDVFLGGINRSDTEIRKIFPQNFKGCIDRVSTKEAYISNYTEMYSENITSCQLFTPT